MPKTRHGPCLELPHTLSSIGAAFLGWQETGDILRLEIVRLFSSSATIMVSGSARDMSLGNSDRGLTMRLDAYVFFVKILCGDCRRSVTGEGYIT